MSEAHLRTGEKRALKSVRLLQDIGGEPAVVAMEMRNGLFPISMATTGARSTTEVVFPQRYVMV